MSGHSLRENPGRRASCLMWLRKKCGRTLVNPVDPTTLVSHEQREALLWVSDHPEVPLHDNLSENTIREQVTLRQVSGGTRSEAGKRCTEQLHAKPQLQPHNAGERL